MQVLATADRVRGSLESLGLPSAVARICARLAGLDCAAQTSVRLLPVTCCCSCIGLSRFRAYFGCQDGVTPLERVVNMAMWPVAAKLAARPEIHIDTAPYVVSGWITNGWLSGPCSSA